MTSPSPLTRAEQQMCDDLNSRIARIQREHAQRCGELGVEVCYSCDWPLTDPSRIVTVTLCHSQGEAKCCGNLCASKVREIIGAPE